ncbi:MAG: S9 family peptidase [Armatimonadetes bacterium]|nr:S9 family peptidase [Armatimonadota bacterium]
MSQDPFGWLEEVEARAALDWVEERNRETLAELAGDPRFDVFRQQVDEILNSEARIPEPSMVGDAIYNFWQDDRHVKGIWRRTTLDGYCQDEPPWEEVLDVDCLAEAEGENWVFKGAAVLRPSCDRALIFLSRGGADARVVREFDLQSLQFLSDGFVLPEAKSGVAWRDRDHLYVSTDFGEGTMTRSGYPRIVKLWRRGEPLADASTLLQTDAGHVGLWPSVLHRPEGRYDLIVESKTFYAATRYLVRGEALLPIPIPEDAELQELFDGWLFFELRSDWEGFRQGSLMAVRLEELLAGSGRFEVLLEPSERGSIAGVTSTRSYLLLNQLHDVTHRLYRCERGSGAWERRRLELGHLGSVSVASRSSDSDRFFVSYTSFLEPSSLHLVSGDSLATRRVKALPSFFDAGPMAVEQLETLSEDGTRVPYFVIRPEQFEADGSHPTLLYGYGGFEVSLTPSYAATVGKAWLEHGGVYAVANIRGGGEFGPRWHQAALKANRDRAFEDFIAVAEDLIRRRITSPRRLGIQGGSNGGLLVGVAFTRRPDLFGAVVCQVPLLDMRRYHKLLAGASWMEEYGDPDDPEVWEFLRTYSPYHNLSQDVEYPRVLFMTSTRDDRVHPGHARKMVALMKELGLPCYYYENTEGGHAGAADNRQRAFMLALGYTYLHRMLRPEGRAAGD